MSHSYGDIPCSVERFWHILDKLDRDQKREITTFGLGCMLYIRPIKMRPSLIQFLVQNYDARDQCLRFGPGREIHFTYDDVEDIMGLSKAFGPVLEPVESITPYELPRSFEFSYGPAGFRIDSLVTEMRTHDTTGDDFIKRFVLVMLGTVLAPVSQEYVPLSYYGFVSDIRLMRKTSWNMVTLDFLKNSLTKFKDGGKQESSYPSHWPPGNLALLQYLYWEKVRPAGFDFGKQSYPLMRRWDEKLATLRDQSDQLNGRANGIIKYHLGKDEIFFAENPIDDEDKFKTPDSKASTITQEVTFQQLSSMEKGMSNLKKTMSGMQKKISYMSKHMKGLPNVVKRLQEFFDIVAQSESESDGSFKDISDASPTDSSSGHSSDGSDGPRGRTTDAYVHVLDESDTEVNESELAKTVAGRVKGTTRKRKVPSSLRSPMTTFNAAKKRRGTDESPMERGSFHDKKTTTKNKSKPTAMVSQHPKMTKKGFTSASFNDKKSVIKKINTASTRTSDLGSMKKRNVGMDYNKQDMEALSPREAAAVQFISNLCAHNETSKTRVVKTQATTYHHLSANDMKGHIIPRITEKSDKEKYICNGVIDAYAGYLSLHITDSRSFSPAWHSFILSNEVQVDRVLRPDNRDSYRDFVANFYDHDMVFFPLQLVHRGHSHWILVVMNNKKREFQVLDSLWTPDMYITKIESMRTGIERMTKFARRSSPQLPTNVGTWNIQPINNLSQQTDGCSCGLFVLKYMELWDGTRLVRDFTQDDVHIFRMSVIADIIFSPTNDIEESKQRVEGIMQELKR